jgi:hypothetical protein
MDDKDKIIRQQNKGGLDISLLNRGTKLSIETKNSIYDFVIIEGCNITIMGGMNADGEIRYPSPASAIFMGSTWGGSIIKANWIGEDMYMKVKVGLNIFSTSVVKNVEIESANGEWFYSMDWNK